MPAFCDSLATGMPRNSLRTLVIPRRKDGQPQP